MRDLVLPILTQFVCFWTENRQALASYTEGILDVTSGAHYNARTVILSIVWGHASLSTVIMHMYLYRTIIYLYNNAHAVFCIISIWEFFYQKTQFSIASLPEFDLYLGERIITSGKNHFHEMNGDVGMAGWK